MNECKTSEAGVITQAITDKLTAHEAGIFSLYLRERHRARPVSARALAPELGIERRTVSRLALEARIRVLMAIVEAYRAGDIDEDAPCVALEEIFSPDAMREVASWAQEKAAAAAAETTGSD
jgi:hypothetical protein